MASIPIVSSSIALSLGAAINQKRLKLNKVTVVFIGDASLEEGIFLNVQILLLYINYPFICM